MRARSVSAIQSPPPSLPFYLFYFLRHHSASFWPSTASSAKFDYQPECSSARRGGSPVIAIGRGLRAHHVTNWEAGNLVRCGRCTGSCCQRASLRGDVGATGGRSAKRRRWGDGETVRRGDGKTGRRGDGETGVNGVHPRSNGT